MKIFIGYGSIEIARVPISGKNCNYIYCVGSFEGEKLEKNYLNMQKTIQKKRVKVVCVLYL